jgi:hypothetical protein
MNVIATKRMWIGTVVTCFALALSSCRGPGGLAKQPLTKIDGDKANGERVIHAGFDSVVAAARESIKEVELKLIRNEPIPEGRMMIGEEPASLWSNGGYARVVILSPEGNEGVTVRVLTLTKGAMNVTANWNYAPKILQTIENKISKGTD